MNIHDIELPAEFRSGNSIPVERATIARERMTEILQDAIAPYQQRIAELESQLEAIGAGGVDGRRLMGDECRQSRGEPESCFKFGHSKHGGECVNVAPQPAESHVDRANRIVDSWPEWKKNYALTKHDVKPTQPAAPEQMPSDDERAAQGLPPYSPRHMTEEEWNRLTESGRRAWASNPPCQKRSRHATHDRFHYCDVFDRCVCVCFDAPLAGAF